MYGKSDYESLIIKLKNSSDEKYRKFNESLIPGTEIHSLGVRIPKLREFAKDILKSDWQEFLKYTQNETLFETVMLGGMVTSLAKCDFKLKKEHIKRFIPRINNWAVCDVFCSGIKDTKKHMTEMREFINGYLFSDKEYELRFAAVMLMDYYLCDEYILSTLNAYNNINHDGYYVKMAVAWGISTAFIKQREKTLDFLHNNNLDNFTFNKAIQKMRESYRVSAEDKEMLLKLKRR